MEISEVRIKLMENTDDRLRAFCSITFDQSFVVRDLKIIDGANGPFVAMPSRKLTVHCPRCGYKNHLKAPYCNQCGDRLREERAARDSEGRAKLYADIAHPINSACREMIQARVIAEFQTELERAKHPGYASRYDDDYGYEDVDPVGPSPQHAPPPVSPPAAAVETEPVPFPTPAPSAAVPPPHVKPQVPKEAKADEGTSGPHFTHKPAEEPVEKEAPPPKKGGDFGSGILDE